MLFRSVYEEKREIARCKRERERARYKERKRITVRERASEREGERKKEKREICWCGLYTVGE